MAVQAKLPLSLVLVFSFINQSISQLRHDGNNLEKQYFGNEKLK